MENFTRIGVEAFIRKGDHILLGLRKNCFGAGTWALPGGHLEFKEKLAEALQRELHEELGINFHTDEFKLAVVTDDFNLNDPKHYIHISFEVKYTNQKITLMEPEYCDEWRFFEINNLPDNFFVAHVGIMNKYISQRLY